MTTPRDIILAALEDIGAIGEGQTPSGENMSKAFGRLNRMIAQWRLKRWLVWHLIDVEKVSTGALYYTIGPGGDYDVDPMPFKIEAAYLRQLGNIVTTDNNIFRVTDPSGAYDRLTDGGGAYRIIDPYQEPTVTTTSNSVDYPLEVLQSMEDYSRIALKSLQAFSGYVFMDTSFPMGKVYPWPVPQPNLYAVHLLIKDTISAFTGLSQVVSLPEEYESALEYQLAIRLAPTYGLPVSADVRGLAKDALNVIREANAQIARMQMPPGLLRGGIYNAYSDQFY